MNWKTMAKPALILLPVSLWAVTQLRIPVDQDAIKQAESAVREAHQDGNSAAELRADRRWLEFYANEPAVQAGIYRAMALLSEQGGDADQAKTWNGVANSLDPALDQRVEAGGSITRGAGDKIAGFLTAVTQTAQAVQVIRGTFNTANPRPAMSTPMQPQNVFPPQPVGSPNYQPQPVTQAVPGYAPPQPQPIQVDAQGIPIPQSAPQYQQPQPIQIDAQGNAVPQQFSPPAPYQPPQAPQPIQNPQPQPQPIQYSQPPQQQVQYRQPQQYVQQPAPYAAPIRYMRPQQARRGDAGQPIKVFHDHSLLGDSNYFEPACGALLLAENGNLSFTATGGEEPLVIPASEILEIRMNTAVAKDAGGFHIITRKGLYLSLAPQGATPEEGREDVDQLLKRLGLDQ